MKIITGDMQIEMIRATMVGDHISHLVGHRLLIHILATHQLGPHIGMNSLPVVTPDLQSGHLHPVVTPEANTRWFHKLRRVGVQNTIQSMFSLGQIV